MRWSTTPRKASSRDLALPGQAGLVLLLLLASSSVVPSPTSAVTRLGFVLSHDMYFSPDGQESPDRPGVGIELGFPFGAQHRWAIFGSAFLSDAVAGNDADPIAFLACELRHRTYVGGQPGGVSPFISFGAGAGVGPFTIAGFVMAEAGAELRREDSLGVEFALRYRPVLTYEPIHSLQAALSLRFGKQRP